MTKYGGGTSRYRRYRPPTRPRNESTISEPHPHGVLPTEGSYARETEARFLLTRVSLLDDTGGSRDAECHMYPVRAFTEKIPEHLSNSYELMIRWTSTSGALVALEKSDRLPVTR